MKTYKDAQNILNGLSPIPINLPKIYFLGDTGAGKTTIIRKILGTGKFNFPTTRQTRTTVAITEYVISSSLPFMGSFIIKPEDEIRGYINEILQYALNEIYNDLDKGIPKKRQFKHIKQTKDQRFRLYYLLSEDEQQGVIDSLKASIPLLEKTIELLKADFPNDAEKEICEISVNDIYQENLIDIENKIFSLIKGKVENICDGYNISTGLGHYQVKLTTLEALIDKCRSILSSEIGSISPVIEYARLQGNILSPWLNIEVVIIDGEGIGHNTKETGKLDSRHYDYFYNSDSIVLVEESKKPFVAGGKSALKSIYDRGYADKLLLIFSKLDEVDPYDVDDVSREDQIEEVTHSLDNVLSSLQEDNINMVIDEDSMFHLSNVDKDELPEVTQKEIIRSINKSIELMDSAYSFSEPVYDFEMLSAFSLEAAKDFSTQYRWLLTNEHWQTIKAFNRRIIWGDTQFRMFTPISDIEDNLTKKLQSFLNNPYEWTENVTDKIKEDSINNIKRELNQLLLNYAYKKIVAQPTADWNTAILYFGAGSTINRKDKILSIFDAAIPSTTNSSIASQFKDDLKSIIKEAIHQVKKKHNNQIH